MKALVGAVLALLILVGSTATVYASQSSLPGDPLYIVKSLSEDFRLSFTTSPQAKLDLTLTYTERRIGEITTLVSFGKLLPDKASDRFKGELEDALLLAANMDDDNLERALGKIKQAAESQGTTLEELITNLPDQAEPAILRLQQRLAEQIYLSNFGESDPSSFRQEIQARHNQREKRHGPLKTENPGKLSTEDAKQPNNGNRNNENHQKLETPGNNNEGTGHGKSTPGSEKSPDDHETPEP
jgi:hypothetical protein